MTNETPGSELDLEIAAHRTRRWSVPMTTDGPLTPETRQKIRDHVKGFRETHGITLEQIARGISGSPSYCSQALGGKVADHLADPLLRQINDWCEQHGESLACRAPTKLVMIKPAERLYILAKRVKAVLDIGVGYGPAGIGKTLTAHFVADKLNGIYVLATRSRCSGALLLRKIHAAIYRTGLPSKRVVEDDIVAEIGGSDRLLIVDQAHKLSADAVETLCDLHEAGRIPILLIGTRDILTLVRADNRPLLGQVSSRVGLRRDLLPEVGAAGGGGGGIWVTLEELRDIFERGPIRLHPAVLREATRLLNGGQLIGLLRTIGKILANAARDLGQGRAEEVLITLEAFQNAFRDMDDEARILAPAEHYVATNARRRQEATA